MICCILKACYTHYVILILWHFGFFETHPDSSRTHTHQESNFRRGLTLWSQPRKKEVFFLLNVVLIQITNNQNTPVHRCILNSMSASNFSDLFSFAFLTALNPHFNTEEMSSFFNHTPFSSWNKKQIHRHKFGLIKLPKN